MKKLLIIFILFSNLQLHSQKSARNYFKEQFHYLTVEGELIKIKEQIYRGVDSKEIYDSSFLSKEKIQNLVNVEDYYNPKEELSSEIIRHFKFLKNENRELLLGAKEIYLLNNNPLSIKKSYLELFLKRAAESFMFTDVLDSREIFGHSYRDRMDYAYGFLKYVEIFTDYKEVKGGELIDYSKFKRSPTEELIELSALCVPILIYLLVIYLILKIKKLNKLLGTVPFLILKRYDQVKNQKKITAFKTMFFSLYVYLIYGILKNIRIINGQTPNRVMWDQYNDNLNAYARIYDPWHIFLIEHILYFTALITLYLISLKIDNTQK